MTGSSLLSVRDLSVSYATPDGPLRAVRNVSLAIAPGEIVGLVGESGCGKSTLMQAILRLLPPKARIEGGRIQLHHQELLDLSERQMADLLGNRIAVVFQDPLRSLNPVLTIAKQMIDIQFRSPLARAAKRVRAIEMLHKVRIPDAGTRIDQYPHEFSGGMRQRIAIAMALMAEPDLLVADEPTTALDATLEVATIDLLKELQREIGCAILFITHHLGVVAELCDRIDVMYAGEIVESGPTDAVFRAPQHPYTQLLFACDPAQIRDRTRHLPTIPGTLPDLLVPPPGCVFGDRCPRVVAACRTVVPPPVPAGGSEIVRCIRIGVVA